MNTAWRELKSSEAAETEDVKLLKKFLISTFEIG